MQPRHIVSADPSRRFLYLELAGFFDEQSIAAFMRDRERAYGELRSTGDHVTLCDVSECKIQAQESFDQFRALLMERARWGRRMAFVVPSGSLAGMQVRRLVADRPSLRVFGAADDARAWLFSEEKDPANRSLLPAT